jgi:hypothetical protein
VDAYSGATVSVWGLPAGPAASGDPAVTSNLSAGDLQACRDHSSLADLCVNVTLSAEWAADPLARDVVYMGLDPQDMPRVFVNLPPAPPRPPDPQQVTWPPGAALTVQASGDGTLLVTWPAAHVGAGMPLQYLLYAADGAGWRPVPGCDPAQTSCRAPLQAPASLYVIAVNPGATPPSQTPQLFGCYPSTTPCGAALPLPAPAAGVLPTPTSRPPAPATPRPAPAAPSTTATLPPAPSATPAATASRPPAAATATTAPAAAPAARDGQTLAGQASHVQNAFTAHYGDAAGERWHAEHEAELARS